MTSTVAHNSFAIERTYDASPERTFSAFADPAAKAQWFGEPDSDHDTPHDIDFRVGGGESMRGDAPDGGSSFTFDSHYYDIVDNERIVYCYEMTMSGRRISVSVATIEFQAEGSGTHLTLTEQGVFLDGLDTGSVREKGTQELLDALGRYLES